MTTRSRAVAPKETSIGKIGLSHITVEDALQGIRLLGAVRRLVSPPLRSDQARATVRTRLERRAADFLGLIRDTVYGSPSSPYLALLRQAGCEFEDVERLVLTDGLETALERLYREGVFLTADEMRGTQDVVRGSAVLAVSPGLLRNPCASRDVPIRSGGSRGRGTPVSVDIGFIRDCATDAHLYLEARASLKAPKAIWEVPGGFALFRLLTLSGHGSPPVRWFSQLPAGAPGLRPAYHWAAQTLRLAGRVAGVRLPRPDHVSPEHPLAIARWVTDLVRRGQTPHLFTFASSAARLCQACLDAGMDLEGAMITMSGEPTTTARLNTVRRAGADGVAAYGSAECGYIGYGCLTSTDCDEMHLLTDLHAVIQPNLDGENPTIPPRALFISSLRKTAPLVLLNVALGDQAELFTRQCGCPLGEIGWNQRLRSVRSYEKLTVGGMALPDSAVIRTLEEDLPRTFGGAPTDYQLVEEERADGGARLRLLVDPRLGPIDHAAVAEAFLESIGPGSGMERLTALLWSDAGVLTVERARPRVTRSGKIQHLHVEAP
jgi:hypothetical protein